MRLRSDQLLQQLRKQLASIYIVSGDEPFQVHESLHAIRSAARDHGFTERVSLSVEPHFQWSAFVAEIRSISLFAERKLVELHIPNGKPGIEGSKRLVAYADNLNPDLVLLLGTSKLERATTASKWYQRIEAVGQAVMIWPIPINQMQPWVRNRAQYRGVKLTPDAVALLADRATGNLFAGSQEIDKLSLLHPNQLIDAEMIAAAVDNSARYSTFDLVDNTLAGNAHQAVRILNSLREEGFEPLAVLATLTWSIRNVAEIAERISSGHSLDTICTGKLAMWRNRRGLLTTALSRHAQCKWTKALVAAGEIDRLVKHAPRRSPAGMRINITDPWCGLEQLVLDLCGKPILRPAISRSG